MEYVQTHHDKIPLHGHDGAVYPDVGPSVRIPDGQTATLAGEFLDILVEDGGTLRIDPGTELRFRTLTINGMLARCVGTDCQLVVRDMATDPATDPSQFGTGIVVVDGTLELHGSPLRDTRALLSREIEAGDTEVHLDGAPDGWQAGDVLILPDTRQPRTIDDISAASSHVEYVTVASVDGNGVTLESPVEWDHHGWRDGDGAVQKLFHVGNTTQACVVESENPNGTRGHILVTRNADILLFGVQLKELGRTTTAPLQPGVNQIGRYALHFHHCLGRSVESSYQFYAKYCSVVGSPKWGIAIHGSHYGLVRRCLVADCAGGHIVTEDPLVYGNTIEDNLVIGLRDGSGQVTRPQGGTPSSITARAGRNEAGGDHWHNKVGLGLASAANNIRRNAVYNCFDGIGMAGFRTTTLRWPLVRGQHVDFKQSELGQTWMDGSVWEPTSPAFTGHDTGYRYPFLDTADNLICGCLRGIETWTADSYPDVPEEIFPRLSIYHTHQATDFEDHRETTTICWKIRGDYSLVRKPSGSAGGNSTGIHFKDSYEFGHNHFGLEVSGMDIAYRSVYPKGHVAFYDCDFDCHTTVYQPFGIRMQGGQGCELTWKDCIFGDAEILFIDGWYPKYDINLWAVPGRSDRQYLNRVTYRLLPYRGLKLGVYHHFQHPDFKLDPIGDDEAYADFPNGVNTHAELISLGTPLHGEVMPRWAEKRGDFGDAFRVAQLYPETVADLAEWVIENRMRALQCE